MIIQIYTYYNLEDALAIARMGADHIGIGCTGKEYRPSKGREQFKEVFKEATIENVGKIFREIKPPTKRVLMPLSRDLDEVLNMVRGTQPEMVHIPFLPDLQCLKRLKNELNDVLLMQSIYLGPKGAPQNKSVIAKALSYQSYVDILLIDTKTGNLTGITGVVHDWTISRQIVKSFSKPVILAGGLNPENVVDAIERVNPWGVDACTQLDERPGKKDLNKVKKFIDAVRRWEKRKLA